MADSYYDLYCDESGTEKSNFFFGAIHCSRARANILDSQIERYRMETGMNQELKWTKVSRKLLAQYKDFVDIFLSDKAATFLLSEISKGYHWRKLASSPDSQFLQAYFHFIEQVMKPYTRYAIFLDDSSSKRYKFNSLHYCLNLPAVRNGRQKKVTSFQTVDSSNNLIQLVDVLLGALTSTATASHKIELSEYVKSKMLEPTFYGSKRLLRYCWTAPEKRRFQPNF